MTVATSSPRGGVERIGTGRSWWVWTTAVLSVSLLAAFLPTLLAAVCLLATLAAAGWIVETHTRLATQTRPPDGPWGPGGAGLREPRRPGPHGPPPARAQATTEHP